MLFSLVKPAQVLCLVFSFILFSSPHLGAPLDDDIANYIEVSKSHLLQAINARRKEIGQAACTLARELNEHAQRVSDFQALVQLSTAKHPDKADKTPSSIAELPIIVPVASQCKDSKVTLEDPKSNADVALCLLSLSQQYQEVLFSSIPFCGIAVTFGPSQMSAESFYWVIEFSYSHPSLPELTDVSKLDANERKKLASNFWNSNAKKSSAIEDLHLTMFAIENQPLKRVYQALGHPEEAEKFEGEPDKEGNKEGSAPKEGNEVNRHPRSAVETKTTVAAPLRADLSYQKEPTQTNAHPPTVAEPSTEMGRNLKPEAHTSTDSGIGKSSPSYGQANQGVKEVPSMGLQTHAQAPQTRPVSPYFTSSSPNQPRASSTNSGYASPVGAILNTPKVTQPKKTTPGFTQWSTSKAPLPIINSYNRCQCPAGYYVRCGNGPY